MSDIKLDYQIQPIEFTKVQIQDKFWSNRIQTSCNVTIPSNFGKSETTGRINNFAKAGGLMEGAYEGLWHNDSDVFKIIEGAAYALQYEYNPELDTYLDDLIAKIAAAQEADGYLYTPRTIDPDHVPENAGPERWSKLYVSHELYNVGHMYEAAVAHFQATGKKSLLNIAIKNADFILSVFGTEGLRDVPGHQEIEIALVRLARVTDNKKYLDLAKFFLDERGKANGRSLGGEYTQDHLPVVEQQEAVGHAVRALYMYTAMTDVAALTGDAAYYDAVMALWENVVYKKIAITGGTGALHEGEAFGANYELPNLTSYNETCAAIANIFWNHRLFLLTGESKYIDVLERTLYNGFLSGVSLSGTEFFYVNPLASDGEYHFNADHSITRQAWFSCSCCPTNVVRLFPSLSGYIYAVKDPALYVNLYTSNSADVEVNGAPVHVTQETNYPWDGNIKLTIETQSETAFDLLLRIPGWATGQPIPSTLYRYQDTQAVDNVTIKINGEVVKPEVSEGYAVIKREWSGVTTIEISLPMMIRRVVADDNVSDLKGKVALERGPIVYALEEVDNAQDVFDMTLADNIALEVEERPDLFDGVQVIKGTLDADSQEGFVAIPYYAWGHRGVGKMTVWLNHDMDVR
ncbi:glycoside hydrolase family 127 protein [Phototrophicus methaneseepsis]|uniref:Glycoside hydrolase family 127 protein n=1 Tax=Phototrophicus methaneseepsis TaxID=2710758 RepID=A0A7S8EB71_9CHLR|nr:glycoside hydrolase family 127 protein [Phototrophicus methaneseepsis]QPC83741.1 glycoside hydrolase family 127 protein [Phototrophicus methaneseepsis]